MKRYLLAASAAVLTLSVSTTSGQVFDSAEALSNSAIAASPRAKEYFPWLTRSTLRDATKARTSDSNTALAEARQNRALAASPRILEQFPELGRPALVLKTADHAVDSALLKNRGFTSIPRAREEFPWLMRSGYPVTPEPFQVAPLK